MKNSKGDERGLDSLIADILGKNLKIYPQAFHGGDMNGVHCRKLIANIEMIMDEVNKVALKRLNERMIRNTQELNVQKQDKFRMKIDKFTNLFHVMDIVFSGLRVVDPTEEEILETKKANFVLENIWRDLYLSITPKAHILFIHAIPQFIVLGGIGDKVEDFVEKSHQEGKRLDALTSRISSQNYHKQQLIQITKLWTQNHPKIQETIQTVRTYAKRKFIKSTSKLEMNRRKCKKNRTDIRDITKKEVIM